MTDPKALKNLKQNDTRNLVDKYKGMANEDIVKDLDKSRVPIEIAIENLSHDFNIGTIIRNANAFNIRAVHIIGKKKYNRRGAMVTDKYLHIDHFSTVDEFISDARKRNQKLIAIENNRPEAQPISGAHFSTNSILIFGSESDGISDGMLDQVDEIYFIEQIGSTRSINVGCASAVAMYEFVKNTHGFSDTI